MSTFLCKLPGTASPAPETIPLTQKGFPAPPLSAYPEYLKWGRGGGAHSCLNGGRLPRNMLILAENTVPGRS